MKKTIIFSCVLTSVSAFSGFDPGGVSVSIPLDTKLPVAKVKNINYVTNGSFEEVGTNPNGWNQEKQKGWIGYSAKKENAESEVLRKIGKDKAADGNAYLVIKSEKVSKNYQNTVFQLLKVPEIKDGKFVLSFKAKGSAGTQLVVMVGYKKTLPDGKSKKVVRGLAQRYVISRNWQDMKLEIPGIVGCDCLDLTFRLYGAGEVNIDAVSVGEAMAEEPVRVLTVPAAITDKIVAVGEKKPGMITFVTDHNGGIKREKLCLAVEIPKEFRYVDSRQRSPLVKQKGNVYYFSLMNYSDNHLRDWYQYQAVSVMLESDLGASGKTYSLRYWLEDTHWKGKPQSVNLQIIPAFKGKRPKLFKTAADFGHEVEFSAKGTEKLAQFYAESGFNCINDTAHNPAFAKRAKELGFERYDENYWLANAYQMGGDKKPENVKFRKVDGTEFINSICPAEIYLQGEFFRAEIKTLIERLITTSHDNFKPNWEPFMYDSRGCFCERCREEFIKYTKFPAEKIRGEWPGKILANYLDIWKKFRSWQHGKLMITLENTTREAGKKVGKESHFIPEITLATLHRRRHHVNDQYAFMDYAGKVPWIAPWGPYIWYSLGQYNEYYPTAHLTTLFHANEVNAFLAEKMPKGMPRPKMISMPHGWQGSFWVTTPEEISMDVITFLVCRWDGSFIYYFPRGYDYRYWREMAKMNDLIAENEEAVLKGKDVSTRLEVKPVTGLPKGYYSGKYEVAANGDTLLPGLWESSPVLGKAFEYKGTVTVAVGNFWISGEHFYKLHLTGLKGCYEVKTGGLSRGIFSADELKKGILMQIGALRWQFVTVTPANKITVPLFDCKKMEALLKERKPVIEAALAVEAKRYNARFSKADLSVFKPMTSAGVEFKVEGENLTVAVAGKMWRINPNKGAKVNELAAPAFWWTGKGPVAVNKAFRVDSVKKVSDGIGIVLSRTLSNNDQPELAGLKLTQSYCFTKSGISIQTALRNTTVDSIVFAFRYQSFTPGKDFRFGSKVFPRNRQVTVFRFAKPDAELEQICKFDRTVTDVTLPAVVGGLTFAPEGKVYSIVVWDSTSQKESTFEPVFEKVILPPGKAVEYKMNIMWSR